jgi:hypothetical protein
MKAINYLLAASARNQSRLILLFIMSLSWWVFFLSSASASAESIIDEVKPFMARMPKSDSGPRKISWASDPELYILFHFFQILSEHLPGRVRRPIHLPGLSKHQKLLQFTSLCQLLSWLTHRGKNRFIWFSR